LVTCVAAAVAAVPAGAADLTPRRPSAPAHGWGGWYFGGHIGYGGGTSNATAFEPATVTGHHRFGGPVAGAQVGYNYVLPSHLLLRASYREDVGTLRIALPHRADGSRWLWFACCRKRLQALLSGSFPVGFLASFFCVVTFGLPGEREGQRAKGKIHLGQLPFLIGPILLVLATLYSIYNEDVHPPEVGLVAGIIMGMTTLYGFFYVHLKLWR
jgi:hypothetical protein